MGWLRSNRRYCGYLSLATLALQIVLSFGHVHLGVARASSIASVSDMAAARQSWHRLLRYLRCDQPCRKLIRSVGAAARGADCMATHRAFRSACACVRRPAGDTISIARSAICLIVFGADRLPLRCAAPATSSRPDA